MGKERRELPSQCPIPTACRRILESNRKPVTPEEHKSIADAIWGNAEGVLRCISDGVAGLGTGVCGAALVLAEAEKLYTNKKKKEKIGRFPQSQRRDD